jgi:PAS domain-containing protein
MKKITEWFQDIPISRKLRLIITITACIALLMEFCISAINNWVMQRQTTVGNLTAQARIIGANSTAALSFNDPKAAEETIGVLRAVPSVEYGVLFSRDGNVFAKYISGGSKSYLLPEKPLTDGYYFEHGRLAVSQSIFLDNDRIGSIVIRSDLRDMHSQLFRNIIIAASITSSAAIIVFLLSSIFQRTISRSLLHLSQLMKDIARTKDYTVRAAKYGQDEIGQLADSFNIMTEDLQKTTVSRDYMDSIIKNMIDSLTVASPDGTIKRVNRTVCSLLGYREDELVGRPLSMIFREKLSPGDLERTENMETTYP